MNLKDAEKAKDFSEIIGLDEQGRPSKVIVPGHRGQHYYVCIEREGFEMTLTCCRCKGKDMKTGYYVASDEACEGNSHKHICFHCLAALMYIADQKKGTIRFVPDEVLGRKQAGIDKGIFVTIMSGQGSGVTWAIMKANPKSQPLKERTIGGDDD